VWLDIWGEDWSLVLRNANPQGKVGLQASKKGQPNVVFLLMQFHSPKLYWRKQGGNVHWKWLCRQHAKDRAPRHQRPCLRHPAQRWRRQRHGSTVTVEDKEDAAAHHVRQIQSYLYEHLIKSLCIATTALHWTVVYPPPPCPHTMMRVSVCRPAFSRHGNSRVLLSGSDLRERLKTNMLILYVTVNTIIIHFYHSLPTLGTSKNKQQ